MVQALELGRSILTTSVLVRSLQSSQWPQAHLSDTDPATNWAWITNHTDIKPLPIPLLDCNVGGFAKLPPSAGAGVGGQWGEADLSTLDRNRVLGPLSLARLWTWGPLWQECGLFGVNSPLWTLSGAGCRREI